MVRRLRGWGRRTAVTVRFPLRTPAAPPLVLTALASAALLALATAVVISPLLRVHTVSWTGPLRLSEDRYLALESACLGQPLFLLSERSLRRSLGLDGRTVHLALHRHLFHTLEVRLESRRAVARIDERTAIDRRGRTLGAEHVLDGLPLLVGFELDAKGDRLVPRGRTVLAVVRQMLEFPSLAPSEVRLDGDDLRLVLADSGSRVRLDAPRVEAEFLKLRIFEQSLGLEPMPAAIDLRFRDQVVVRGGGGRVASRRSR